MSDAAELHRNAVNPLRAGAENAGMTIKGSDAAAARAAQLAAQRAAEAARKAAEAAKKAAEAVRAKAQQQQQLRAALANKAGTKPTASAVRQAFGRNEFSTGAARALKQQLGTGTSLRTEVLGDGKVNCLERAVGIAKPRDNVVLLTDKHDPVGHAVVERPDGSVVDPNRPNQPYSSLNAYLRENPRYADPAKISDVVAEKLLRTPPGKARDALIAKAGLSDVAARTVADPGHITAQYQRDAANAATDAQAAWDSAIANGGSELEAARAAADVLEAAAAAKADPEFRRYVANASVELAEDIGRAVGAAANGATSDDLKHTLDVLAKFTEAGSDTFTRAAAAAIAAELPDRAGRPPFRAAPGDALHDVTSFLERQAGDGNIALTSALGAELGKLGKTEALGAITPALTEAVEDVHGTYDSAQQKYVEAEAQLGVELQRFGPAMTDAQKQEYIEAFWSQADNAAIKSDLAAAETQLAQTFEATAPGLEAAAKAGDERAAELLVSGATKLATSQTQARVAIDFVERVGLPENKALFDALNHDGTLEDTLANEVLAPALGNAQAAALAGGEGVDLDGLVAQLKRIKDNATNFKKLHTEIGVATEQYDTVKRLLAEGKTGEQIRDALRLDDLTREWEGKTKIGKALAVFGVVGAMGAAISADGNLDRIQASLETVRGGLELTSGVLSSLGRAGKLAQGAKAATFLAKFAPGVGLVADSIQLAKDIQTLREGGNVGDWVSTFGTVVNLAGDIAGFIPVAGQVVDGVLTAVGTVIQGVGGLISSVIDGNEEAKKNREEIDARLKAAGVDAHTREVLLTERVIDPTSIAALGIEGQAYIDALEATQPWSSEDGPAIEASQKAWHIAAAYGLSGQAAVDFVEDFTEKYGDQMGFQALQIFGPNLERFTMAAATLARDGKTTEEIAAELSGEFGDMDGQLEEILGDMYAEHLEGHGANPPPGFYQPQFINLPS